MPHFNIQQHLWYPKLPIYCPREVCTWVGSIPPEPIPPIIPQYNKEQALLESNTSNMWWTIPPRLPIMWVPFQCYGRRLVGGHLPCHRNPSRHDNTWVTGPQDALFPRWQNILGPIYIRIQVSPYQPVKVKATLKFVSGHWTIQFISTSGALVLVTV